MKKILQVLNWLRLWTLMLRDFRAKSLILLSLNCRKHAERIILLVEMLQDSGFPCFKCGPRTIQNLRKRFHLSLTEEQCVSLVLSLISSSLDAWRTRQYDYYQKVLNGIF